MQSDNLRFIAGKIKEINDSVTADFREFWQQKIGKTNRIFVQFDIRNYDSTVEGKAGKPYLVFWINDGQEMLHPKQRSKGLRWFLSFYLRLKAGAEEEVMRTFSVITTEANSLLKKIHNTKHRMPAILEREFEGRWLEDNLDEATVRSMLHPYDVRELHAYTVPNTVTRFGINTKNLEVLDEYVYPDLPGLDE